MKIKRVNTDGFAMRISIDGLVEISGCAVVYTDGPLALSGVLAFPNEVGSFRWQPGSTIIWQDRTSTEMSDVFAQAIAEGVVEPRPLGDFMHHRGASSDRVGQSYGSDGSVSALKRSGPFGEDCTCGHDVYSHGFFRGDPRAGTEEFVHGCTDCDDCPMFRPIISRERKT